MQQFRACAIKNMQYNL